ncbi:uncharacterized protein LOC106088076 [Stomoxys calcitrans]|uniref:uncharacterized protein LOC106088076 n=1 Tax=Stomoxys calcitrans TaxID=35570 RepID=UPI0027E2433B|nr:uncharacterized protein LOC106088076 [Stomoxys calcitrans]
MELKFQLCSLFVILSVIQVSHGQLMCYVCENCPDPKTNEIPQETCDDTFFETTISTSTPTTTSTSTSTTELTSISTTESTSTSTTESTTQTTSTQSTTSPMTTAPSTTATTESPTPTESSTETLTTTTEVLTTQSTEDTTTVDPTTSTSTTEMSSSTEDDSSPTPVTTSTTENTTATTTTISTTTEDLPPSPPTISTSSVPTPPTPGAAKPIDDLTNETFKDRSTPKNYVTSSEFRVRQLRAVSDYTYHCYKVLTKVNGTMVTNRGCSRVKTMESVCGQWKEEHPDVELNKCYPCSNSLCNGSIALNVSVSALVMTVVAVLLHRQ